MKRLLQIVFLAIVFLAMVPLASQGQISLLRDINNSATTSGSNPNSLTVLGSYVYYAANDGVTGTELWRSDGTLAGTTRVKDIRPGDLSSNPSKFTVVGSYIYFVANDGEYGTELWRTDGTEAGTIMIKDINPGDDNSSPDFLTLINSTTMYFSASEAATGRELWKTDINTLATTLITDINAGIGGSFPQSLLYVSGTTIYFSADNGSSGSELWKTDGTTTILIEDIYPGSNGSFPYYLTLLGTSVLFQANNGTNGVELWVSTNGTAAGTNMLTDIYAGAGGSYPTEFTIMSGYVYFSADDGVWGNELWRSNGVSTNLVYNVNSSSVGGYPYGFTVFGGFLYFSANDGINGYEVWRTSGISASLTLNINAGAGDSYPAYFTLFNSNLYFQAYTPAAGYEMYQWSGSVLSPVYDLLPGSGGTYPRNFTAMGTSTMFFSADDGTGYELWKFDGTTPNQVVDLVSGSAGSYPEQFVYNGSGTTFFTADDGTGAELWKTDGTTGGTVQVKNISASSGSYPYYLTMVGSTLFFQAYDDTDYELWKSDGTNGGTTKLDINAGAGSSSPSSLFALNSTTLIFQAYHPTYGTELWKSVSGGAPTVLDINPGVGSSYPYGFAILGSYAYFQAYDVTNGYEVWRTDGTTFSRVSDISPGAGSSYPYGFTALSGYLYFQAESSSGDSELWRTNGAAPTLVKDINTAAGQGSYPYYLTAYAGNLYFQAYDAATGSELWKSDGTAVNTVMVKDIYSGIFSSNPQTLTSFNGKLYFVARDEANGNEMWSTDGTTVGTTLFKSLNPGAASGNFQYPVIVGSVMYFIGNGATGGKVWVTDGRECATIPVPPYAGPATAGASSLASAGSKLIFSMAAQGTEREPFTLDPTLVPPVVATGITTHPATQTITQPSGVTFTVVATGSNLTYTWQKNSVNIPSAPNSPSYNIPNVLDSDAGNYRCVVTGTCGTEISNQATLTVVALPPTAQPTNLVFSNPTTSSIDLSFTAATGSPTGYLVLRKQGSAPTEVPVDGTTYTVGTPFGSSTVIRSGPGTGVADAGLSAGTQYFYKIFSFNGSGGSIVYLATNPLTGSGSTVFAEPTEQPTSILFSNVDTETLTVSFSAPPSAPTAFIAIRKAGSAPTGVPLDGTTYAAGNTIGDATVAYAGSATTFNDIGLDGEQVYHYKIFSGNGANETINYLTTGPLQGSQLTLAWEPLEQPVGFALSNLAASSFTVSFSAPPNDFPTGYLAIRKTGSSPTGIPLDGTVYAGGAVIGDGTVAYVGSGTTFNEAISPTGVYYDIFSYNGGTGTINYFTASPLQGTMDQTPPVFENKTAASIADGFQLAVAVKVTDPESGVATASVTLEFKSINSTGTAYTSRSMTFNGAMGNYETSVSDAEIGEQGLEFRFKATNLHGTQGASEIFKTLGSVSNLAIPIIGGSELKDYKIIAVPLVFANKKANVIFDQLLPVDKSKWRMYRYQGGTLSTEMTDNLSQVDIEPGRGYWLISKSNVTLEPGQGTTVDAAMAAPFTIDLTSGWNLIGNPYRFRVNWNDVVSLHGSPLTLKVWNGVWADGTVLEEYRGGFVQVGSNVSLKIPTAKTTAREAEIQKNTNPIDAADWEVRLELRQGDQWNTFGGVGMSQAASPGYDAFDDFTLPRLFDYLELNHPKKALGMTYTKDMVPTSDNYTWEFTVESSLDGITEMSWDNSYFGINDKSLILWDDVEQLPINMRDVNHYSFSQKKGRLFKVFFGSKEYVSEKASPNQLLIHNLFPNPTNGETQVVFSIPGRGDSQVRIEVLNMLGQPMATVFEGQLQAGTHQVTWSGKDRDGNSPSAGIYLLQVSSGENEASKRLMVIR